MSILSRAVTGVINNPFSLVIYGIEGVGKTWFAAKMGRSIIISTEDGAGQIPFGFKLPVCRSYEEVMEYMKALYLDDHDYETVVVDSLDWLEKLAHVKVCREHNSESINLGKELGYGNGYKLAAGMFSTFLEALDSLRNDKKMNVILLAHSTIEKFDSPLLEAPLDRYVPRLQKEASHLVREWADAVFFANRKQYTKQVLEKKGEIKKLKGIGNGTRIFYTEESPAYMAKNRYNLPAEIPFDDIDFNEFKTLIYGENK